MKHEKLVFFGTEDFSAVILQKLIDAGYEFSAIITKPDAKSGRGKKTVPPAVKTIGQEKNIPVLQPGNLQNVVQEIAAFNANFAILAAYGKLVPKNILDVFSGGIINVHPSLLPTYRGPSPIESAILNGDAKTGVSIIKLVEKMDAGPLYAQEIFTLHGTETKPELYETLAAKGADLLNRNLPTIFSGEYIPEPQDETAATYCALIKKTDGIIDWKKSAAQIERHIRAYRGWPGSRTELFGQEITILEAEISEMPLAPGETSAENQQLFVGAGEKSLEIKKLRPAGRSSMNAIDFLRGLRAV